MIPYATRFSAALSGQPHPPGGDTIADRVLANRQQETRPMITLTINASSFSELAGLLATAQGSAMTSTKADKAVGAAAMADHVKEGVIKANAKAVEQQAADENRIAALAAEKAKADAKADAKPVEQPANDGPPIAYADLQLKVMDLVQGKGREAMIAVLAKLGVDTIKGIDEARFAEVKSVLDAALAA